MRLYFYFLKVSFCSFVFFFFSRAWCHSISALKYVRVRPARGGGGGCWDALRLFFTSGAFWKTCVVWRHPSQTCCRLYFVFVSCCFLFGFGAVAFQVWESPYKEGFVQARGLPPTHWVSYQRHCLSLAWYSSGVTLPVQCCVCPDSC